MDFNTNSQGDGTYSYDLTGYVQTSYVNITANEVDAYTNNQGYVDLQANALGTVTASDSSDHGFSYKCHIDVSGMFNIDFNLPNFLSVPGVNLTLFKKMNEFSRQIRDLNDNMIAFIQSTDCCEMSYEYNKTIVPIFRYLADHPDTIGCNLDDPKVSASDKCAAGSSENFMSEILKAITQITKVYTAIEPIFCIIKPIPGNPWLPMDFNWIRPILPYIEKFGKFSEKIMSGELIDVIIDPVKDINRSLFNCRQENNDVGIDKTISSTVIINSIKEIENKNVFQDAYKELQDDAVKDKSSALETLNKYSDKDLTQEYAALNELSTVLNDQAYEKRLLLQGFSTELNLVQDRLNHNQAEADKIAAYYTGEKNKPLKCLNELITFRPDIPKLPWINIGLLPTPNQRTSIRNDLIQVSGEKAYDITYEDIYGDTSDFSNSSKIMKEKIRFDNDTVLSADFIQAFTKYMVNNGEDRSVKSLKTNWLDYISNSELSIESFKTEALENAEDYFLDKSTLEGVLDRDFDTYITANGEIFEEEALPVQLILDNNQRLADSIVQIQEAEAGIAKKAKDLEDKDQVSWGYYREKALSVLRSIKKKYKIQSENEELPWMEQADLAFSNYTVEKAEYLYAEVFQSYKEFDIIEDPMDERLQPSAYVIPGGITELNSLLSIVHIYLAKRKSILGELSISQVVTDLEEMATVEYTSDTSASTIVTSSAKAIVLELNEEVHDKFQFNINFFITSIAEGGAGGTIVPFPTGGQLELTYMEIWTSTLNDYIIELDGDAIRKEQHLAKADIFRQDPQSSLIHKEMLNAGLVAHELPIVGFIYRDPDFDYSGEFLGITVVQNVLDKFTEYLETFTAIYSSYVPAAQDVTEPTLEVLLIEIFKYERIKKEYFQAIDSNVAFKFYVVDTLEIKLGCNIICELIQFVVNYLLAIIKKLLMMLVYWLIDYLVPDWLKNIIRLILYKLKCFLMMAYNVSSDPEKNRLLKIDNTYDSFMQAIKNRVALYPYDACAKTAIENASSEAAEDNTDTSDSTNPNIIEASTAHDFEIYFVDGTLRKLQSISRYNHEDIKIIIKKDPLSTLSNVIIKDYEDSLIGISATDITDIVNGYDNLAEVNQEEHFYITTTSSGDLLINNLDLSLLTSISTMVSADSYKSTADIPEKYDSHVVTNRYSTLNIAGSTIQLQDSETESYLVFLENNKRFLKILFKEEEASEIVSVTLTDNTPYVTASSATSTQDEIIGSEPLPRVLINLRDYDIHYDGVLNLKYFIYDCTDFFPAGNDITGTLNTMFEGENAFVQDSILCKIDTSTNANTATEEEISITLNDTIVCSIPVVNPGINPNPTTAAALQEAGTSQARASTPVVFDCTDSNGTIIELLEANYELWVALGLVPDIYNEPEEG